MPPKRKHLDPASHKCSEVRKALRRAIDAGCVLTEGGHWGMLWAPDGKSKLSLGGTVRSCGNLARQINQWLRRVAPQ
jgi:hypothetical protein